MLLKSFAAGILFMLAAGYQVQGQFFKKFFSEIELIGGVGTTNYFGDIGGADLDITGAQVFFDKMDIDLWQTRMACITGVRVARSKNFTLSLQLSPMLISGNDQRSKYPKEFGRNYSFKTSIVEFSLQGEYYFSNRMTGFAPYGIAGIGAIAYSVYYTSNTLDPAPPRTPMKTANTFILGLGGRFPSKNKFIHTFDFGFHFSTTDFLDAYNTTRNTKDLFFQISYKVGYQLYNSWYLDHRGLVR